MSEVTPEGLATKIVAEIPNFFRDGIDQILTGEGEYIRAGEPRGQVGKIGQAVARSYCRQYGANPGAAKFGNAERIENACRPYLDDISPGNGPEIGVPFDGGQCPGAILIGEVTGVNNVTQVPFAQKFKTRGPLVSAQNAMNGAASIFQVTSGGSVIATALCTGTAPTIGPVQARQFGGTRDPRLTIQGVSVFEVCAGSLDNCGNPPPTVRQPRPIADPTGPNFRFNPGGGIDIDLGVEVNPDGTIDVDIGTGPINVDLFPPDGGGNGGGGDDEPGDVGEEDTDGAEDADENGSASGCAGENQVLGGLKIAVTTSPPGARLYAPGIFRGACYIYMGVESNLDLDFGGSMVRDGQFFLPEKENLTCWEVQANLGYRLRVTPYYKTIEEDG